jgi:hypothetical protein
MLAWETRIGTFWSGLHLLRSVAYAMFQMPTFKTWCIGEQQGLQETGQHGNLFLIPELAALWLQAAAATARGNAIVLQSAPCPALPGTEGGCWHCRLQTMSNCAVVG